MYCFVLHALIVKFHVLCPWIYPLYEHVYKSCFKKLNYKNIYYNVIVYGNEDISSSKG